MAYNYNPLTYTPYSPTPRESFPSGGYQWDDQGHFILKDYTDYQDRGLRHDLGNVSSGLSDYQDYTGQQLQGLTGNLNLIAENPLVTGQAFGSTPLYTPFGQTRQDYTSGGDRYWATGMRDDMHGGLESYNYETNTPVVFDQQGYLDAQFGNINSYLNNLGSFLGGISNDPSFLAKQHEVQALINQSAMPQVGATQASVPAYTGGGWGQASPTQQMSNITQRQQAPAGILGTTNRGAYGGILGGE